MLNAIFVGIRFVILVLSGHGQVALENAALRQQLAVFKRDIKRPRLLCSANMTYGIFQAVIFSNLYSW